MRNVLVLSLLVPMLVLAGASLTPVKVVADDGVQKGQPAAQVVTKEGPGFVSLVGTVDTIGGTTYDWQANGPAYRFVVNSVDAGLHALWMFSADQSGSFPDRNMRYNFYDYGAGSWNWIDPDFMQSGVNAYTARCGFGNLSADPVSGVAYVSSHGGSPIKVTAARDMAPGAGIFEYCAGPDAYLWGYIAAGHTSKFQCHMIDDASRDMVYYSGVDPWCTWSTPMAVAAPQPDPEFPDQNIACSNVSDKVCLTWVASGTDPEPGFYRISEDGGLTWGAPTDLPWPPAYSADTAPSFYITSLFPFYDANDRLHIVTDLCPVVGGTGYVIPAQIWHWCPDNTPNWSHIATASCAPENLGAPVGNNALYACRPSIGQDAAGNLYVAWEQFDSSNVEPGPPDRLRADIFVAGSRDNGQTWGQPVKITQAGTTSCRYPSMVDLAYNDGTEDKLAVLYMIDQIAGSFVQQENVASNNPIVCHWIPTSAIGIAEPGVKRPVRYEVHATPNPFGSRTVISYALPRAGNVSVMVYDEAGRPVRALEQGQREPGQYSVAWDGRSDSGEPVAAGVYFYKLSTGGASLSGKLTVVR
ncbi:MAG: FlgD immunoglobulin-like domain containing protein [candidate division WOR-3 bacterium]